MSKFKKMLIPLGVLLVVLALVGCTGKLAATVNGRKIYLKDVEKQLEALRSQHGQTPGAEGEAFEKQFKNAILDGLIRNELLLDYAQKQRISVSQKEVNQAFNQIKSSFPSSQAFKDRLKQLKMSEAELKRRLKEDVIFNKVSQKIYGGLKVTEAEAKGYYSKNQAQFQDPEQVKVRQIVSKTEENARKTLEKLKGGASFEEIAKKESIDTATKDKGGNLGLITREGLSKDLADVAFTLKIGSLSEVIPAGGNFYIIKVEEKIAAKQKSYEESKDQVKQVVLGQKQKGKFQSFLNSLRKKAKIRKFI